MNPGITLVDGTWYPHSYTPANLEALREFVLSHERIVLLSEFSRGDRDTAAISVRHDVDHSAKHAVRFATWEHKHGIKASYYLLPDAPYYATEAEQAAKQLDLLGHEVGVHNNTFTACKGNVGKALKLLQQQAEQIRSWGVPVIGCADHGGGNPNNTLLWRERHRSPTEASLEYEAYLLHQQQTHYLSDNRGAKLDLTIREDRPTHLLCHPCHWQIP